ncbi:hypothetical protein J7K99_01610 [bacterium]|nr:hypothetical protein [bacterium]
MRWTLIAVGAVCFVFNLSFSGVVMNSDSTAEDYFCPGAAGLDMAEWFYPPSYPCTLSAVAFYIGPNTGTLYWKVWDDDGIDPISGEPGDPGTILAQGNYTVTTPHSWVTISLSPPVVFPDGKFYIGWQQLASDTITAMKIGFDRTPPHMNYCAVHYYDDLTGTWYWVLLYDPDYGIGDQGDLLIAGIVGEELRVLASDGYSAPLLKYVRLVNNNLSIEFSIPLESPLSVEVFDYTGRMVWRGEDFIHRGNCNLKCKDLGNGIYLVRVSVGGLVFCSKLAVVR